jgi:hypothetical protein
MKKKDDANKITYIKEKEFSWSARKQKKRERQKIEQQEKDNRMIAALPKCGLCQKDIPVITISNIAYCPDCFLIKDGYKLLAAEAAEYHGGHKAFLAGGMFSKYEMGQMILTSTHLIFIKRDVNPEKRWEIIIPLKSIILDRWSIEEESRRKTIAGGGTAIGDSGLALGGGAIHDSGKAHHIVVPYIDANGIRQEPRFGVSSFRGKAIREWASTLYQQIVTLKKEMEVTTPTSTTIPTQTNSPAATSTDDPMKVLKMRLAKGQITKEEFEELRKMLES